MLEIWDTVRHVCEVLRTDVARLMVSRSSLPELDQAVSNARDKLAFLGSEVFDHVDRFPEQPAELEFDDLRRALCVAIGKLHGFLVDTLGEILAADPRSSHDMDYFLARKFPRDVEEAEWLQTSVSRLDDDLRQFNAMRHASLGSAIDEMTESGRMPTTESWQRLAAYLDEIEAGLAPRLMGIIGLRGIRIDELDVLLAHAFQLPESCRRATELHDTACTVLTTLAGSLNAIDDDNGKAAVIAEVERALCSRINACLHSVEDELRDLAAFVPLWLNSVDQRRALILHPNDDISDDSAGGDSDRADSEQEPDPLTDIATE